MRPMTITIALLLLTIGSALVLDTRAPAQAGPGRGPRPEVREISADVRNGDLAIELADAKPLPPKARGDENRPAKLGDIKYWLALDDFAGEFYVKTFQFRGVSQNAELWVATDLNFPEGDCRNDGIRNVITDAQVAYMLAQFDNVIRPIDTDWFGEPAVRTGRDAVLRELLPSVFGNSNNAYISREGRDVILVDNVVDTNYYDTDNANSLPRIAGFFTSAMADLHDRNVITIDSYDWTHGTGENPPHEPSADPCLNQPARPFLYESVFAHEYQHLIHNDFDPDETSWVNEGLSMFAEIITGYTDPSLHVDQKGVDSSVNSFLGWWSIAHPDWNPIPRPSGPENSLTNWGDQGDLEILEDYGNAFYFMTLLNSRGYGQDFFTAWHHNEANGIAGLDAALSAAGGGDSFAELFLDMQASVLTDGYLDAGAAVAGVEAAALQNTATDATIYFSGNAYDTPGAPPWGSDFIPLGPGSALTSVAFNGAGEFVFPATPGFVLNNGYFAVIGPDETSYESNMDVSIAREVAVGAGALSFTHYVDTEEAWDFGFVQVSTDGGQTWTSLPCEGTTTVHDPGAIASIQENVPGYTGNIGTAAAPVTGNCDLSAYSGTTVLLSFRFISDPSVEQTGWFIKDITLDGAPVGTPGSLDGWTNQKFFDPAVLDFEVQFIGLNGTVSTYGDVTSATDVTVVRPALDANNDVTLTAEQLAQLAASAQVVAIISGIPEAEENGLYQPYSLLVNGAERADGQ